MQNSTGDTGFLLLCGGCYRIGGDEFAVICKNVESATIESAISEMRRQVDSANVKSDLKIDLACGYAFGGEGNKTAKELFAAADKEMYRNKCQTETTLAQQ